VALKTSGTTIWHTGAGIAAPSLAGTNMADDARKLAMEEAAKLADIEADQARSILIQEADTLDATDKLILRTQRDMARQIATIIRSAAEGR